MVTSSRCWLFPNLGVTHSCSLQPEPEWHRPPDLPRGHDVTAGRRRGVRGQRGCAAGRRQPRLPGHQPPHVPAPPTSTQIGVWVWAHQGESRSNVGYFTFLFFTDSLLFLVDFFLFEGGAKVKLRWLKYSVNFSNYSFSHTSTSLPQSNTHIM